MKKKTKPPVLELCSPYQYEDRCDICYKKLIIATIDGYVVYVKHSTLLSVCVRSLRKELDELNEWRRKISEVS